MLHVLVLALLGSSRAHGYDDNVAFTDSPPLPLAERTWMQNRADPPEVRAQQLLAKMTLAEKVHMFHGSGSGYTGNVAANARLSIPAIKMNDGPQGFRAGTAGTSTAFPSALMIGATFDDALARQWGEAMGEEFYAKGANVQLGPGMCLARVPRNGRNFEYIPGEDPYLGARLVEATVRGIQSKGVIANAKHYVNNNQETARNSISAQVDERTEYEMYYPAFEGAVKGGVGSVMCSYNRVNSVYACENSETLVTGLKNRLGFKGWVMSDWGATHSLALNRGLDQEMPGSSFLGDAAVTAAVQGGSISQQTVDNAVLRILTPMFAVGIFDTPSNGTNAVNASTAAHNAIARRVAAAGTVLLRNNGNLLPLDERAAKLHLAVIGTQATAPTVGGGGSGAVRGPYTSAPLDAIRNKLGVRAPADCDATGAKCVYHADSGQAAIDAAAKADVAIVFVYTTSSEGSDRASLSLSGGGDQLIADVFGANPKTVVVAVTPGALLTPWNVPAIFASIMPGQEYGNAIADLIFGDVNPSARLPVTFPNVENEVRFTAAQYPGTNGVATYSEGLEVGYRWYDANRVAPRFPFGHGLSYTTFEYSGLSASNRSVMCTVRNTGSRAGAEVAQLYLGFPSTAGEPPQQLKGFQKITLNPGASGSVTFPLDDRSFSIWNTQQHAWTVVRGQFQVHVGSSSRTINLQGTLTI